MCDQDLPASVRERGLAGFGRTPVTGPPKDSHSARPATVTSVGDSSTANEASVARLVALGFARDQVRFCML